MSSKLDWIKEIDYEKIITGDLKEISDEFGIDILLKMFERFRKTHVYFSEKFLNDLRKEYIVKNIDQNVKELARKLDVSEIFVQHIRKELNEKKQLGKIINSVFIQ